MAFPPQTYPQVGKSASDPYVALELLTEIGELRNENRRLRRRVATLEERRTHWRTEAQAWKWGALRCRPRKSA